MSTELIPILLSFIATLIAAYLGGYFYIGAAKRLDFYDIPNRRSLHTAITPTGGGIIIAIVVALALLGLLILKRIETSVFYYYGIVGLIIAVLGLLDDAFDSRAIVKLGLQIIISIGLIFFYREFLLGTKNPFESVSTIMLAGIWLISLVWFFNGINFIDGTDGLLGSGVVFFFIIVGGILLINAFFSELLLISVLCGATLGILLHNLPPASFFLGDSGSSYIAYSLSVLILHSASIGAVSLTTWAILLAYFLGDTTTTTLLRLISGKRWDYAHRSCLYQNLARKWNSHKKLLLAVNLFHVGWVLPLVVMSIRIPSIRVYLVILAYAVPIVMTIRYGPLYEDS